MALPSIYEIANFSILDLNLQPMIKENKFKFDKR